MLGCWTIQKGHGLKFDQINICIQTVDRANNLNALQSKQLDSIVNNTCISAVAFKKNSQLDINDTVQGFECSQVTFLIPKIKNSHALFKNQVEQFF